MSRLVVGIVFVVAGLVFCLSPFYGSVVHLLPQVLLYLPSLGALFCILGTVLLCQTSVSLSASTKLALGSCPTHPQEITREGARFCRICGTNLYRQLTCGHCRTPLELGYTFCDHCGHDAQGVLQSDGVTKKLSE